MPLNTSCVCRHTSFWVIARLYYSGVKMCVVLVPVTPDCKVASSSPSWVAGECCLARHCTPSAEVYSPENGYQVLLGGYPTMD